MHAIANNRAELTAASVDHASFDRTTVGSAVVTKIGCDRAGAEIHLLPEDRVTKVREMPDVGAWQED